MKKKKCISFIAMTIGCWFLFACTNPADTNTGVTGDTSELPINIRAQIADLAEDAKCVVYKFGKTGNEKYSLKDSIQLTGKNSRMLAFNTSDWLDTDYRFLFISLPESGGITIENQLREPFEQEGELWENIRISVEDPTLVSGEFWYGIIDKTSLEIEQSRIISGKMQRLVGQLVLDIYRGENINEPVDIQNEEVLSVLDRVDEIEMTYTGLTNMIRFSESGEVLPLSTHTEDVQVTYPIVTQDEFWRVPVSEIADENNPFLTPATAGTVGSVRIGGIFGFPTDKSIQVKAVFRYYDTTAQCGQLVHVHTKYCHENSDESKPLKCTIPVHTHTPSCGYEQRSIVLNLPGENANELLSIMPNMYTVNKAAIRYDRIIDVSTSGDFNMAFDWDSND